MDNEKPEKAGRRVVVSMALSQVERERFQRQAERENRPLSSWIRHAAIEYLRRTASEEAAA